jgi:hypothetical protein
MCGVGSCSGRDRSEVYTSQANFNAPPLNELSAEFSAFHSECVAKLPDFSNEMRKPSACTTCRSALSTSPRCTGPANLVKEHVGGNAIIRQVTKRLVASTAHHMDCDVYKGRRTVAITPKDGPDVKIILLSSSVLQTEPNYRPIKYHYLRK